MITPQQVYSWMNENGSLKNLAGTFDPSPQNEVYRPSHSPWQAIDVVFRDREIIRKEGGSIIFGVHNYGSGIMVAAGSDKLTVGDIAALFVHETVHAEGSRSYVENSSIEIPGIEELSLHPVSADREEVTKRITDAILKGTGYNREEHEMKLMEIARKYRRHNN